VRETEVSERHLKTFEIETNIETDKETKREMEKKIHH